MQPVPPARPVFPPDDRAEITSLIDGALATGALTLGPLTARFEDAFAARHQSPHAVAVSSGTAALEIIMRAIDVTGREVIVPTNTFFATAAAVMHAGGVVRFADVDETTFALSPRTIEPLLNERTAAVVLVHIGGTMSADAVDVADLCRGRGVALIEDAAHAHGSSLDGRPAGTLGLAGAFSFYPTKVITSGEGGMIVTGDERLRDEARTYRDQGKASFLGGDHVRLGSAWRMSELHAAVGVVQLARLDDFLAVRRRVAAIYDEGLRDVSGITPLAVPAGSEPNYYKYIALLDAGMDRASIKAQIRDGYGVSLSGEVYASPLHHQPVFASVPHGPLPVAEDVCARHVCLPVHSDMTDDEAHRVVDAVTRVVSGRAAEPASTA